MKYNDEEKKYLKISWANFIRFYNIDLILCNEIAEKFPLEFENIPENETDEAEFLEIFQYYLFNERDLSLIKELNAPVFYCAELDLYILGVTHFGTSWDYVLTDVNLVENKEGLFYPSL